MNTNEESLGREEDDGTRGCCQHGVPMMCVCKQCDGEEGQALLAPARGCAALITYDEHEKQMLAVIDERDAAEQALSQAYYLVTGRSPEWSNNFGHAECLQEIDDSLRLLKSAAKQHNAELKHGGDK
jgi:hypothetical protein